MPNLLHRLKINEVSSVARGAGKGVKVVLMKTDKVEKSASVALPILFKTAIEHGASIAAVAKAEVAMNEAVAAVEAIQGETAQATALETSLSQCVDHLAGLVPTERADAFQVAIAATTQESDMPLTVEEKAALAKAAEVGTALEAVVKSNAMLTRQVAVLSMSKEHQEYFPAMPFEGADLVTAQDKFIAATPEKREEAMKAFPPKKGKKPPPDDDADDVGKAVAKALAESPVVKAMQAENAELKKASRIAEFKKQATDMGLPEEHGETMMKAYDGDKESQTKHNALVKQALSAAGNQEATANLFREFGKSGGNDSVGATAYDQIKLKGDELRKLDPKLSPQQARNKVMSDPANAALVQLDKQERMTRIRTA
jgi:hypothetical protein